MIIQDVIRPGGKPVRESERSEGLELKENEMEGVT